MIITPTVRLELLNYYHYCKQIKVEISKSLILRDLRINSLLDMSESNIYKECLDNLNIVLKRLDEKEKEIDILISSIISIPDKDILIIHRELDSFAELINTSIEYSEYIHTSIKEIIKI